MTSSISSSPCITSTPSLKLIISCLVRSCRAEPCIDDLYQIKDVGNWKGIPSMPGKWYNIDTHSSQHHTVNLCQPQKGRSKFVLIRMVCLLCESMTQDFASLLWVLTSLFSSNRGHITRRYQCLLLYRRLKYCVRCPLCLRFASFLSYRHIASICDPLISRGLLSSKDLAT